MSDPSLEYELVALQTAHPPPSGCELEALRQRPSDTPRRDNPQENPSTRIDILARFCIGLILAGGLSLALRHPGTFSPNMDGAPTPLGAPAPPTPTSRAYHRISASLNKNNFNATKKFSFVHISKCAGATFIRLLKDAPLNVCPPKETGFERSAWNQHHASICQGSDIDWYRFGRQGITCTASSRNANMVVGGGM